MRAAKRSSSLTDCPAIICIYVLKAALGLKNPLALRDYLRTHPDIAQAYGDLKKQLADQFPHDIDSYVEGKTDFIMGILRQQGFSQEQCAVIDQVNRIQK